MHDTAPSPAATAAQLLRTADMTSPDKGAGSAQESALREERTKLLREVFGGAHSGAGVNARLERVREIETELAALATAPPADCVTENRAVEAFHAFYHEPRRPWEKLDERDRERWRCVARTLATDSQAPGGREGESELLAALLHVQIELAALVADPSNPDFSFACPNPADSQCLEIAYETVRAALAGAPPPDTRPAETVRGLEEVAGITSELERELGVTGTVAVFRRSLELAREARAGRIASTGTGWDREGVGKVLYEHAHDCLTKVERDGIVDDMLALHPERTEAGGGVSTFPRGSRVRKTSGSSWHGKVVGHYSTDQTPDGVCVESEREVGSVQIYPAKALAPAPSATTDAGGQA